MLDLVFSKKMVSNFKEIDEQHEQIIMVFNELKHIIYGGKQRLVKLKLRYFIDLMAFNCAFEQTLLLHSKYLAVKTCIKTHNNLLQRIDFFQQSFLAGDNNALANFLTFMESWLKNHLVLEANTYVQHILEFFSKMDDTQRNEYVQKITRELQNLNSEQIKSHMFYVISSYDLV